MTSGTPAAHWIEEEYGFDRDRVTPLLRIVHAGLGAAECRHPPGRRLAAAAACGVSRLFAIVESIEVPPFVCVTTAASPSTTLAARIGAATGRPLSEDLALDVALALAEGLADA